MKSSSKEVMKVKEENFKEKIKEIHYDKNKNYSLNDYINLETLSLFTEQEFYDMFNGRQFYYGNLKYKRIYTCQKEIIEKLLDNHIFEIPDKIIKNLHKIDKNEYINILDFSHIKSEDYSKLTIVEKIPYFNVCEFVKEFCIPEKRADLNDAWKELLKKKFWLGRISRIGAFIFLWLYLLYARRYGLFFLGILLYFTWPFQLLFRLYVALNLPELCYEWDAPNMRKYLAENYEQWVWK